MQTIDIIGTVAAIAFAVCGLPQAIKSYREKHSDGMSMSFILLWLLGEVCMITYVVAKVPDVILLVNYVGNLLFVWIIFYYKLFPNEKIVDN